MLSILKSWQYQNQYAETMESILEWIAARNETVAVSIQKSCLSKSSFWFYDEQQGTIHNQNNSFFRLRDLKKSWKMALSFDSLLFYSRKLAFWGFCAKRSMA